ncbi:uncharacterized protein LOC121734693 [Aricia agestis]|uniref:uncharacterized protein LOC121734693 n=1 Tax=Aricia agestis TaxID=91739 RepID=UPI001C208367|nr:uncharacterized protein LOC121734693 [Aricia agestis]
MLSLKTFSFLATLCVAYAAVAIAPSDKKPEKYAKLEGCYMADIDKFMAFREQFTPTDGSCLRYNCYDSGDIQIASCGAVGIPPGCEPASGDLSLPYPKCCGGFKCKNSDGTYKTHFP